MARTLTCPHCQAEFGFDDWSRSAACPACGQRVSFFAAAGLPEPPEDARGKTAASAPAGERQVQYVFMGKPLEWTRGWTAVMVVWAVAAVLLVAARAEMGHLVAATPAERATIGTAILAVRNAPVGNGTATPAKTGQVLDYMATHDIGLSGITAVQPKAVQRQTWYGWDYAWLKQVNVYELQGSTLYAWIVHGTAVTPASKTADELEQVAKVMANPPAPGTLPSTLPTSIPGL